MGFADRFGGGKKGPGSNNSDDNKDQTSEEGSGESSGNLSGGFSSRFAGNRPVVNKTADGFSGGMGPKDEKGNFTDNISKKNQPQSFTDQVTRRADLVYLVHGKDRGKDAWHYVLVDKPKLPMFLKQIETGSIDVALYGEVLRSGWGKNPPPEMIKEIEEEFGD